MSRTALYIVGLLAAALAATVSVAQRRIDAERAKAGAAALYATNVVAERDSTRDVAMTNRKATVLLGDSLRVVEKQVVQVVQRADALDVALGRERRARYSIDMTADSLQRVIMSPARNDSARGIRSASFELRHEPYTISAQVEVPAPPGSATLAVRVALDPIHIDARLSCAAADEHGIRSASITAAAPKWASVRFDRVEQSPELCASPALLPEPRHRFIEFRRLMIGAGGLRTAKGQWTAGAFVGAGLVGWL